MVERGLWDDFLSAFTVVNGTSTPYLRDKDLIKQLRFRGYIPLPEYKRYNPKKYCYIMANKILDGVEYIFPARFTHNYKLMRKGIPNIHKEFGKRAIPGSTKIQYSKT